MSAFGLSVKDANGVVQALASASGASSATMSDLIAGFANVGNIGKDFRLSVGDTATVLAIFAENGLKGAEAGTQLRSMLTNMSRTTSDVHEAWKSLGTSLYDATGTMRPLEDVIDDLNRAMEGMSDEDRNFYIQTLAGSFGKMGLSALLAAGGMDSMKKRMEEVPDAAIIAAGKMDTFSQKLESLKGSMEGAAIKIFTPLLDALKPIAEELTLTANSVGEWAEANPELAAGIVKLGAIILVGMPILNLFVSTLTSLGALISAGGTLISGLYGLAAALGPVGAALGIIGAAGGVAVGVLSDTQRLMSRFAAEEFQKSDADMRLKRYANETSGFGLAGRQQPGGLTNKQIAEMISRGIDPQSLQSFDPALDMDQKAFQWTGDTTPAAYGKAMARLNEIYLSTDAKAALERGVGPSSLWEKLSVAPNFAEWAKLRGEIVVLVTAAAASVMAGAAEGAASGRAHGGVQALPRRATGGPVSEGKAYLVGELGPEIFVPRERGTIMARGREGGSGKTIFNVTINGNWDPAVLYEKWMREKRRRNR